MISVELELSEEGYARICRLCERYGRAGGNPSIGNVLALSIHSGIEAQEKLLDAAAMQNTLRG